MSKPLEVNTTCRKYLADNCSCKANLWVDADMEGAVYQEQCLLQVCRDTTKIDH